MLHSTEWRWNMFLSQYFGLSLSIIIPPLPVISIYQTLIDGMQSSYDSIAKERKKSYQKSLKFEVITKHFSTIHYVQSQEKLVLLLY
jgi:hypothetical protein